MSYAIIEFYLIKEIIEHLKISNSLSFKVLYKWKSNMCTGWLLLIGYAYMNKQEDKRIKDKK